MYEVCQQAISSVQSRLEQLDDTILYWQAKQEDIDAEAAKNGTGEVGK